jgi:DNA-binding MarR family transcriptional regulator
LKDNSNTGAEVARTPKANPKPNPQPGLQLDLSGYFPYLINRVGALFVASFTGDALDAEDLSIQMWRVLAALSNNGGQRQIDLATMTSIEVSTLSRIVARLMRRGLITRKRSRADNREFAVALSAAGQKLVRRLIPIARAHEKKAIEKIAPKDLETARRVLRAMYGNLAN